MDSPLRLSLDENQSQSQNPSGEASGTFSDARFEQEAARIPDEILEAGDGKSTAGPSSNGDGQPTQGVGWPEALVRGIFELPTAFVAGRLGEYWRLTDLEISMLVLTGKPVLDEYLPFDSFGKFAPLLAALTVVFGPRVAQYQLDRANPVIQSTQTGTSVA